MNTDILDKKIIVIDSTKCNLKNNNTYDYHFNLLNSIKNVLYIKLIESTVVLNKLYDGDGVNINNQDNINISLNNYDRLTTNITNNESTDYLTRYFDTISIDKSKYLQEYILSKANSGVAPATINYTFSNNYTIDSDINSPSMYVLNPAEPSLAKFNITVTDKNNTLLTNTNINRVIIKICVYYSRKKITMS
jgi:hypothetical protein